MHWNDAARTFTLGVRKGAFPGMLLTRHLTVVLPDGSRKAITYTGLAAQAKF